MSYIIIICATIWFISIVIPQTSCCSSKLYIGITTCKSSALSIFMPLIFVIQLINFFNFFSLNVSLFALLVAVALAAVLLGTSKSSAVNVFFFSEQ